LEKWRDKERARWTCGTAEETPTDDDEGREPGGFHLERLGTGEEGKADDAGPEDTRVKVGQLAGRGSGKEMRAVCSTLPLTHWLPETQ